MHSAIRIAAIALSTCGLTVTLTSCGATEEAVEDVRSWEACDDYCDRKFDCADESPSAEEDQACTDECIDTIDDTCGAEYRSDAIDQLNTCVEQSCGEFYSCLVFETAPACFGFVD